MGTQVPLTLVGGLYKEAGGTRSWVGGGGWVESGSLLVSSSPGRVS